MRNETACLAYFKKIKEISRSPTVWTQRRLVLLRTTTIISAPSNGALSVMIVSTSFRMEVMRGGSSSIGSHRLASDWIFGN